MARRKWTPPDPPKFNLSKIFSGCLVIMCLLAVAAVIATHVLIKKKAPTALDKMLLDDFFCKIPDQSPTLMKKLKIKKTKLSSCHAKKFLTSITSTVHFKDPVYLKFHPDHLNDYKAQSANCCFNIINRIEGNDNEIELSEKCQHFEDSYALDHSIENIFVKCNSSDGKEIYRNAHAIISKRKEFEKRQKATGIDKKKAYKVLMLGIDEMSRLNFERGLKSSYKTLHNSKFWFEMKGYTRLSNATFPNLFTVLTGQADYQIYKKCDPMANDYLDECDFIWKEYQEAGYITNYAEDQRNRSSFNVRHKGFRSQPTDHYFRPFVLAAEKEMKTETRKDLVFCLGNSIYSDHIIVYATKTIRIHEFDPFFAILYTNSLNEKQMSTANPIERRFAQSFVNTLEELDLSSTILIYFGDTGLRFEETEAGFYEERSPFLFIRLPERFQNDYPDLTSNLRSNSERLTTPYDLHITLRHILNLSVGKRIEKVAVGCPNCKSLFEEIPRRSCSDVRIPRDSCPCSLEELSTSQKVVKFAAQHAVEDLNRKLKLIEGENCSMLTLKEITSAKQELTSAWNMNFLIRFTVSPSKAKFEALMARRFSTIISTSPQFELLEETVHVNIEKEPQVCVPMSSTLDSKRINEEDSDDYD